ncbi:AfsR/SARP family transcriptional regulator [Kribbella voronezhensis]|uniref:AfsR/SARP family transcriptional regulator n=1 Tax=Kribbella voronezhensis TaxID=2512212 RepID=UPI001416F8CC|nr:BTAD domain-containing putative transcriptional regulator [Kribbella voronezhensis]
MHQFDFRILGPLSVTCGGEELLLGGPKQRGLLAALLLNSNRRVALERLAELLWDEPPQSATANLRTYASGLRRVIGDRLLARDGGYELAIGPGESDVERFGELVSRGRAELAAGNQSAADSRLREALDQWRGRCGEDLPGDIPLARHLGLLDEQRLLVLEDSLQLRLDLADLRQTVTEVRVLLTDHSTRERLWAVLMTALYRSGDVAGSLAAYRAAAEALDRELGMRPGQELRDLQQAILARDPALETGEAVRTPGTPVPDIPRQLPRDSRVMVGRDDELAAIMAVCSGAGRDPAQPTVVSIDGQAGVGKSALALRAAHLLAGRHPDGQLYVDLRGTTTGLEPVSSVHALAGLLRALGDPHQTSLDEHELAARFRTITADRALLLVLDNASHTQQVLPLLPASGNCTALVTSRRRLTTLDASLCLSLDVLSPAAARATLTEYGPPGEQDEEGAVADVAELCGRLPLALRIAAARRASRPDWSLAELARQLADDRRRLDELSTDDVSVRAAFAATFDALRLGDKPGESTAAELFRLMGALPMPTYGEEVLAALADVAEAELKLALRRLVDLHAVEPRAGRFVLHDLLRLFAAELAEHELTDHEREAALARVFSYCAEASRQARAQFRPVRRDLPAVVSIARQAPRPRCDTIDQAAIWFDSEREALRAMVRIADRGPAELYLPTTVIVDALSADLERDQRLPEAIELNETLARIAERNGDNVEASDCWRYLASCHQRLGNRTLARDYVARGIELARKTGQTTRLVSALNTLAIFNTESGDFGAAESLVTEALGLVGDSDEVAVGILLNTQGMNARWAGDNAKAVGHLLASLAIRRRVGDRVGQAYTRYQLGRAYLASDRLEDALLHLNALVELAVDLSARDLEREGRIARMQVLNRLGRLVEAKEDLAQALDLCEVVGQVTARSQVLVAAADPAADPERDTALATG